MDAHADRPLLEAALPEFEKALIQAALLRARGRRQEAARLLGWGRNTLTRKIKELSIDASRGVHGDDKASQIDRTEY